MKSIIISTVVVSLGICLAAVTFLFAQPKRVERQPDRTLVNDVRVEPGSRGGADSSSGTTTSRPRRIVKSKNRLKQMYRQLETKMARLEQLEKKGTEKEIDAVQNEIKKLEQQIESHQDQADNFDGEDIPSGRPPMGDGFPRPFPPDGEPYGVEPDFIGEPDMPPMDEPGQRGPNDLRRRIQHIHQAARHLEEAGMHERARDLMEEAEEMERDLNGNDMGELVHLMHELHREVKQLRREVHQMRKQMGDDDDADRDEGNREDAGFGGEPVRGGRAEEVESTEAGIPDEVEPAPRKNRK